jgi:hypothetical protein
MKTALLSATCLLTSLALAGCLEEEGPLVPHVAYVWGENNQNYTLAVWLQNTGDGNVSHIDGRVSGRARLSSDDGSPRVDGMVEYFGHTRSSLRLGEPPRRLVNDTDTIPAGGMLFAQAIIRYEKPLPETAEVRFDLSVGYRDEVGVTWSWAFGLPCYNVHGETIRNSDGRECDNIMHFSPRNATTGERLS